MKRAMTLVMRVGCNEESDGFGGKSNGNEGGRRLTACDEEGEGNKVMARGIRVAGDEEGKGNEVVISVGVKGGVQQREQWLWGQERWQRGWQAIDGDKQGDGDGDGNNVGDGDGDEAGGRQRGQG